MVHMVSQASLGISETLPGVGVEDPWQCQMFPADPHVWVCQLCPPPTPSPSVQSISQRRRETTTRWIITPTNTLMHEHGARQGQTVINTHVQYQSTTWVQTGEPAPPHHLRPGLSVHRDGEVLQEKAAASTPAPPEEPGWRQQQGGLRPRSSSCPSSIFWGGGGPPGS